MKVSGTRLGKHFERTVQLNYNDTGMMKVIANSMSITHTYTVKVASTVNMTLMYIQHNKQNKINFPFTNNLDNLI